jgi:hypothetical protein
MQRQTSIITNQGKQGTCLSHAFAKVLLQNVYRFVHSMNVEENEVYKFKSCFVVLNTDKKYEYDYDYLLSEKKCGRAGYHKILLFIYLYSFIVCDTTSDVKNQRLILSTALTTAIKMLPIHGLFKSENERQFNELRTTITETIRSHNLKWTMFYVHCEQDINLFLKRILIDIVSLGLYIYCSLIPTNETRELRRRRGQSEDQVDLGHAVTMVKYQNGYFGIAGSYGKAIENTQDITHLYIHPYHYTIARYLFILPMYPGIRDIPHEDIFYDEQIRRLHAWVRDYVENIKRTRAKLHLENLNVRKYFYDPPVHQEIIRDEVPSTAYTNLSAEQVAIGYATQRYNHLSPSTQCLDGICPSLSTEDVKYLRTEKKSGGKRKTRKYKSRKY